MSSGLHFEIAGEDLIQIRDFPVVQEFELPGQTMEFSDRDIAVGNGNPKVFNSETGEWEEI